jgi:molecular chaperone GrpE
MKKTEQKTELEKKLEAELAGTKADTEVRVPPAPAKEPPEETVPEDGEEATGGEDAAAALNRELEARKAEVESLQDRLLRLRAEFDNYRKRTLREGEQVRKTAAEKLFRDLFPVLDNLERALDHAPDTDGPLAQGVAMVLQQFRDVLSARGVTPIAAVGEPFDPAVHEALTQMDSAEPAGTVIQEYERGYKIGDYILRPAKVVVSGGPPSNPAPEANENIQSAASGDALAAE